MEALFTVMENFLQITAQNGIKLFWRKFLNVQTQKVCFLAAVEEKIILFEDNCIFFVDHV